MTDHLIACAVYKVRLVRPVQTVDLPEGARVVAVATQDGDPCLWAEVVPSAPSERRTFAVHPTGAGIPPGDRYAGTAHDVAGQGLVMHVYERDVTTCTG